MTYDGHSNSSNFWWNLWRKSLLQENLLVENDFFAYSFHFFKFLLKTKNVVSDYNYQTMNLSGRSLLYYRGDPVQTIRVVLGPCSLCGTN